MQMVKMASKSMPMLVLVIGIGALELSHGKTASRTEAEQDCDGFMVTDTAYIDETFRRILDTSSYPYIEVSIALWERAPYEYHVKWNQKLFTDYRLYQNHDTLNMRLPGDPIYPEYLNLLATKATILALSKECYVSVLRPGIVIVNGVQSSPRTHLPSNSDGLDFNVKGQRMETWRIPFRTPGTPAFPR